VAGVSKNLAESIVKHRDQNGAFKSRKDLLTVKGFGPKAFEQAAGFMRVSGSENPLDCSAVHPENYPLVESIAEKVGVPVVELVGNASAVRGINVEEFLSENVGKHTLEDIIAELEKPSRDPRKEFRYAKFDDKIQTIQDLITGSWMEGVVTNVANFGAFVDIGVHQDGLVHVSEISDKFVDDAKTVLTVGDVVKVRVMAVNVEQKRISLSMKQESLDEGNVAGAGQNAKSRFPQQKNRRNERPAVVQGHATIADLKAKLAGKNVSKQQPAKKPQVQISKVNSMLKQIMKKG
jgi:uncharacterized protein